MAKKPGKYIWFNGNFVPWDEAHIHLLTHGLHYATSVFEGERAYNGKVFKVQEHTARLFDSAEALKLDLTPKFDQATVNAASEAIVAKNGFSDCYIRPVVWKGNNQLDETKNIGMGVSTMGIDTNVAIAAWDDWEGREVSPLKLLIEDLFRRPHADFYPSTRKASGLYSVCAVCRRSANEKLWTDGKHFDDALLLGPNGTLAETTAANVFLVLSDKHIITPKPDCFLDGITRQTVLEIAKDLGFTCESDQEVPVERFNEAKEVFVTGTLAELTPVVGIEDRRGDPANRWEFPVGETFTMLQNAYFDLTGKSA